MSRALVFLAWIADQKIDQPRADGEVLGSVPTKGLTEQQA